MSQPSDLPRKHRKACTHGDDPPEILRCMPWPVLISRGTSHFLFWKVLKQEIFWGASPADPQKNFRWKMGNPWGKKKTGPAKNPSEVKQRILGGGGLNHFEPPSWKICASQIGIISPSSSCHQLVIPWSFSPSQMERIVWTNRQTT